MVNSDKKHLEQEICRVVARIIKEDTGRGPVSTEAFLNDNNIMVIVSGFMLPIEIEMTDTEYSCDEVRSSRVSRAIAKKDKYIDAISKILNRKVTDYFVDFNPKTDTAVRVMLF